MDSTSPTLILYDVGLVLSCTRPTPFFFFSRDKAEKKNITKKTHTPHLAAVFDCRTIIVGYYNYNNIIIQLACAYNIDDLYHTGRIASPGMEKVVYIVCVYYTYPVYIRDY